MLERISYFKSLDLNAQTCKALLNLTSYNFSKVAFFELGITETKDIDFLPIYPVLETSWIRFE